MGSRIRIRGAIALVLALLLLPASLAQADDAYQRVAAAYGRSAGRLDPCSFSKADLQAAVKGIPKEIATTVPAIRQAMQDAIAAHDKGSCKGIAPTNGASTSGAAVPPVATPTTPATTPASPATTEGPVAGAVAPGAAPTTPSTATPAPGSATQPTPAAVAPKAPATHSRDTTPLLVVAIAIGVLALLALLTWAWWRLRGLDPRWTKSWRHAWGEAGYRTTSTWSEFTDWLRLGR
jgi:cobalamin biosynthesis Mg chelatase CobN